MFLIRMVTSKQKHPTVCSSPVSRQRIVLDQRAEQFVVPALPMRDIARPAIVADLLHHRRANRVRLDVSQYAKQMVAVLDHRALEPPLPDVAAGAVTAVVSLCVRDQQSSA